MKIRESFVTNSSSSSFIVKVPLNMNIGIINKEQLQQYFVNYYGDDTFEETIQDRWCQEQYDKYKIILDGGFGIVFASISNDNYFSDIENLINELGFDFEWVER